MNSLAKIAISFYVQLMHIVQRVDCEWETIDDLIKLVSAAATEAARLSVQAIVSIFNAEVFMSPMIARDGWRRKDKTMKTLETSIGVLFLERHTYQHKKSGKCVALLFEALGIKPHQRTSRELMFRVLDLCPEMSFRKAIHATGTQVCVQTAINWLRNKMPVLERIVTGDPRKAEVLHVFLDEDHLSMLKDPHRKHMILPVGAVAEGHTEERKGRFRLIHRGFAYVGTQGPESRTGCGIGATGAERQHSRNAYINRTHMRITGIMLYPEQKLEKEAPSQHNVYKYIEQKEGVSMSIAH